MTTPLAVVVVAYGAPAVLAEALAPLSRQRVLVVVDNSSDPEVARVVAEASGRYVDAGTNLGFAGGVNLGLRHIPPEHDVLLLNPDAVLSETDLRALHTALRADPSLSAVSPQLEGSGGRQRVVWPFPSPSRAWVEALGGGSRLCRHRDFLVGAVLLLRHEALVAVGEFDERFFLYGEETDWQRRATAAGWTVREIPSVTAQHVGAGTSADNHRRDRLFHAAQETYVRKWFGGQGWQIYRSAVFTGALLRAVFPRSQTRRQARLRLCLYLKGPRRVAIMSGDLTR